MYFGGMPWVLLIHQKERSTRHWDFWGKPVNKKRDTNIFLSLYLTPKYFSTYSIYLVLLIEHFLWFWYYSKLFKAIDLIYYWGRTIIIYISDIKNKYREITQFAYILTIDEWQNWKYPPGSLPLNSVDTTTM